MDPHACCLGTDVYDRLRVAIGHIHFHYDPLVPGDWFRAIGDHGGDDISWDMGDNRDLRLPMVPYGQAWTTRDSAPYPRIWEATQRQNADNVICHGL